MKRRKFGVKSVNNKEIFVLFGANKYINITLYYTSGDISRTRNKLRVGTGGRLPYPSGDSPLKLPLLCAECYRFFIRTSFTNNVVMGFFQKKITVIYRLSVIFRKLQSF